MDMNITAINTEDVIRWPCGTTCFRYELPEMTHKSDDYEVLRYGSTEWCDAVVESEGGTND